MCSSFQKEEPGCPVLTSSVVRIASWKPLGKPDLYPLELYENRGLVSDLDLTNLNVWMYKSMAMCPSWQRRRRERNSVVLGKSYISSGSRYVCVSQNRSPMCQKKRMPEIIYCPVPKDQLWGYLWSIRKPEKREK